MTEQAKEKRPPMVLWLVSYFFFVIAPLSIVLSIAFVKFGMSNDIAYPLSFAVSLLVNRWYESLTDEVSEYLAKKYND